MRRTITSIRRHKIVAGTLSVLLVIAAAAIAAWMITAVGPGRGQVGQLDRPVVTAAAAASEELYPGQLAAADFTIHNPNSSELLIVATEINNGPVTGFTSDCPEGNVTTLPVNGLSIPVPPGDSNVTIPGVFRLSGTAPNGCQGIEFTKTVALTFSSP